MANYSKSRRVLVLNEGDIEDLLEVAHNNFDATLKPDLNNRIYVDNDVFADQISNALKDAFRVGFDAGYRKASTTR